MATPRPAPRLEDDISIHIFTVSAGMVGVCLTVIGLLRVIITLRKADTFADNLLAIDAFLFPSLLSLGLLGSAHPEQETYVSSGTVCRRGLHRRAAPGGGGLRLRGVRYRG